MDQEQAGKLAVSCGFTNHGFFRVRDLVFRSEVRDMCEADRCGKYNKRWTCPPACGSLTEICAKTEGFNWGILLQSTGYMEDAFDAETLVETMEKQKEYFEVYVSSLKKDFADTRSFPMSSGGCDICNECTYPDSPCRFPDRAIPSMEALGLLVNDVCDLAGIPYYYGKDTITFSSCVLFE